MQDWKGVQTCLMAFAYIADALQDGCNGWLYRHCHHMTQCMNAAGMIKRMMMARTCACYMSWRCLCALSRKEMIA